MTNKKTNRVRTHYQSTEDGRQVLVPGTPTRSQRAVSWLVWHLPELGGVLVPAGVAVAVTPAGWLAVAPAALVSAAVAVGWVRYEVRTTRQQAAIKAGRDLPALTAPDPDTTANSGGDASVDGDPEAAGGEPGADSRVGGGVS